MARPIEVPNEVLAFLSAADELRDANLRINPLTPAQSAVASGAMQEIDVARTLGLVVLDDADDSNPYCYISHGPARGMVVHFSHDPEPTIRFHNLDELLSSLQAACNDGIDIDDLAFPALEPLRDQGALSAHICALLDSEDEDAALQLGLYVPLLFPNDLDTLGLCADSGDFLVREITATFLLQHGQAEHRRLAERLARDRHPQVADPARQALARLQLTTVR